MELTKDKLTAELASLRTKQEQALANLNVITGGVQTIEQLIAFLDKPEAVEPPADTRNTKTKPAK